MLKRIEKQNILKSGFDGFYTYFASNGFTDASRSSTWKELNDWAESQKLVFIPSIGFLLLFFILFILKFFLKFIWNVLNFFF